MDYDLMRRRLVEARELIGCNRKEFADKLNIPYRTITNYENGAREAGSDYLARVATVCGVTTDWILGVSDDKKSPSSTEAAPGRDDPETDSLRSTLLYNFEQLNQEGQERLVETSDDMVSSGKYIKSDPAGLDKEA